MRFINYLEHITGVSIYPLISLLVFFIFFTALTIGVLKASKKYMTAMKNIPLSDENNNNNNN